jgi:hypothetical protein
MRGDVLHDMLAEMEAFGDSPESLFADKGSYTEFYLLYAFVLRRDGRPDKVYDPSLA